MEKWELLDENGEATGRIIVRGEPLLPGQYHLVEHIWIVDSKGRILIQRRADHLRLMAGMWAATGGSAIAGEDSESAARRELFEELGIRTAAGEMVYGGRMRRRSSFTDIWLLYRDIDPATLRLQAEEVAEARWVTPDELVEMLHDRRYHHYGIAYFQFVFRAIERGRRTLYATDLDGTLLRDDATLSPYTVETLNRLISRGMMVTAATARGLIGATVIGLDRIHFRQPVILLGGVLLYDLYRHRILHACEMPTSTVSAILEVFDALKRAPQLYRRRGNEVHIYYTDLNPLEAAFVRRVDAAGRGFDRFYHRVGQLRNSPAIFFSCQGSEVAQKQLADRLAPIPGIRVVCYRDTYHDDNWFVEICREDADKGRALERLKERAGADRVVAFGDNINDLSMFRVADLACCVDNGDPQAKAAADTVINSNEQDGVAQYLNAIYNRRL